MYLPPAFVGAGAVLTYYVGDDGSTYTDSGLAHGTLARASEGVTYPASFANPSVRPATAFNALTRTAPGMILPDPARFGGTGVVLEAALFTGTQFQTLGAITTAAIAAPSSAFPDLRAPTPWPAFTYAPSRAALNGTLPAAGTLTLLLQPIAPNNFIPACELILTNRAGQSLLMYLPEVAGAPNTGVRVMVADDGSTYFFNPSLAFNQLNLARASLGQALPVPGVWPVQQRYPVALNLCRVERTALLLPGQLGIDPELGRFALPAGDPALAQGNFSVDFAEAFSDAVGATSVHATASAAATRWISQSGDAPEAAALTAGAPVHTTLASAVASAREGDVIEIADSATYSAAAGVTLANALVKNLTIRAAAGRRPCLTFYSGGAPTSASLTISVPMDSLVMSGILISGGPLVLQTRVGSLALTECTLDPAAAPAGSLLGQDPNLASNAVWLLSRCIAGGLMAAAGTAQITVTDSIVDRRNGAAIAGLAHPTSPPDGFVSGAARTVQLERVTVFGQIWCEILKASETLLDQIAVVDDQQSGCVRFTRFERGSVLPRRYQCIPNDEQAQTCGGFVRCLAPVFNSRTFGRPEYAQLAPNCPREIMTAAENGSEVGAFAGRQNTIRRLEFEREAAGVPACRAYDRGRGRKLNRGEEMKGDFSRITFDPGKHYGGVLHQQGRVWLDSDWNEDVLERLAAAQREIRDIVGFCGVPSPGSAFVLSASTSPNAPDDFNISAGRCYVDGIPCILENAATYHTQPDLPDAPAIPMPASGTLTAVVYLEVWRRLITYLEDPSIREIALGGPDTSARLKTVVQVRVAVWPDAPVNPTCAQASTIIPTAGQGTLTTLQPAPQPQSQCQLPDPANYTGRENHLYRVEIHDGGDPGGSGASFQIALAADAAAGSTSLTLATALTAAQAAVAARERLCDGGR